jgi:hypothetical protein
MCQAAISRRIFKAEIGRQDEIVQPSLKLLLGDRDRQV